LYVFVQTTQNWFSWQTIKHVLEYHLVNNRCTRFCWPWREL